MINLLFEEPPFLLLNFSEQIALYTILLILILWCFFGLRTIYNKINTMTK